MSSKPGKKPKREKRPAESRDMPNSHNFLALRAFARHRERFKMLVAGRRLPPVVLIEGEAHIGKRQLAAYLAALLVCESHTACGACFHCEAVLSNRHGDLFWLEDDEVTYKLELAHAVCEHLSYMPMTRPAGQASYRLAVLLDVDKFNRQAANALLKTLEETPGRVFVIMTTARPAAMLATILSRAVRWRVRLDGADARQRVGRTLTPAEDKAIEQLLSAGATRVGVLQTAEMIHKQWQWSAAELLEQTELKLHDLYSKTVAGGVASGGAHAFGSPARMAQRRRLLQDLKQMVWRDRISLNVQMVAEQLSMGV